MVNDTGPRLRRREIAPADLGGVVDLLVRGFPLRPRLYWERGLARMGERPSVAGCPHFGFLLDDGSRPVGVSLMLYSSDGAAGGGPRIRCNLSSWAVDPPYRMSASMLIASALGRRDVTFLNLSPASHTWSTIEAQGFRPYAEGQSVVAPALSRARERVRVVADPAAWRALPEAGLLDDHARCGCTCLALEAGDGLHPIVLLPVRARSGRLPLPLVQLIFCRDVAALPRFAAALGRWLLRRGMVGLVLDGEAPEGLALVRRVRGGRKYFRGPHPPRIGDLSYTERVIFGP